MNIYHLSAERVRGIAVGLPTPHEQSAIADFLDAETACIDMAVSFRKTQRALLAERHAALRATLVLRDLDPMTGGGMQRRAWGVAKLGIFISLQRGHDLPTDHRREGPVPVVSSGGVSGYHDIAACPPPGVVTGRYGTVGEVYFVDRPYWPLNTTLYVSDFRGQDPHFVKELLSCLPLQAEAEKSAVGGINRNVIGDLRVPVPPVDEQRRIANLIADAERRDDQLRSALVGQIDLQQERKQALITAAVTGQLALARQIAEEAS